jgi:hypothetical protein
MAMAMKIWTTVEWHVHQFRNNTPIHECDQETVDVIVMVIGNHV